ncbi:MAG: hypothetical protein AAGN66_10570 [Acidobacteriota bacterium]
MKRSNLLRLCLSSAAVTAIVVSLFAVPAGAQITGCFCTIPFSLQINAEGGSCGQAQADFQSKASAQANWFCRSINRPTEVCDGPNVTSQSPCYWDYGTHKWRIDGFVDGHCLFCPGPKF